MTVSLFRSAGQCELDLITRSGFTTFPMGQCQQRRYPVVFYPERWRDHALQIARDWNTRDSVSELSGYLLRCQVETDGQDFLNDNEIWLSEAGLRRLNQSLVGTIEVVESFIGSAMLR